MTNTLNILLVGHRLDKRPWRYHLEKLSKVQICIIRLGDNKVLLNKVWMHFHNTVIKEGNKWKNGMTIFNFWNVGEKTIKIRCKWKCRVEKKQLLFIYFGLACSLWILVPRLKVEPNRKHKFKPLIPTSNSPVTHKELFVL